MEALVASGRTGRKGSGGFYRLAPDRSKLALDLATDEYRPARRYRGDEPAGAAYAAAVREQTLAYAERILDEVSGDPGAVDLAMEAGYAWRAGPFAMLGRPPVRPRRPGAQRLSDLKQDRRAVRGNASASVWDIGEGVLCLEFHTKMNAIDGEIVHLLAETIAMAPRALVLHNDGAQFSVGANLAGVLLLANTASWDDLDGAIRAGQDTFAALRYAPFPGRRRAGRHGARRRLRGAAALRRDPGARRVVHRPARGGRRHRARLGRLPAPRPAAGRARAVRPAGAGAGGVRDDRPRHRVRLGGRGPRARLPRARPTASR